jgi:diguanylate cyclase
VDRVLCAELLIAVPVLAWLATGAGSDLALARVSWLGSTACNVVTLVYAWQITKRLPAGDPARRFWRAVTCAAVLIAAGYALQTAMVATGEPIDLTVPATVLMSAGFLGVIGVMVLYPLPARTRRDRLCFWLDTATVMVGVGAFGWYFTGPGQGVDDLLAGPVLMLVGAFAVTKLLLAGRPPYTRWTGVLFAVAGACGAMAAAVGPSLVKDGRANWFLAVSLLADVLITLGTRLQRLGMEAGPESLERRRRRPYSTLPYTAVGATFLLLVFSVTGHGLQSRSWAVLAGAAVSTALVVVRQLASFAENSRLLDELRAALAERDRLATELHRMAFEDSLTGLANRALFHDRLDAALAHTRRYRTETVVMLVDLDDFKPVNDRFGHAAGDAVLREVAVRLRGCLRETDTVARLGGDEFGVILSAPLPAAVDDIAARLVAAVRRPCAVEGGEVTVGASIGVAADESGLRPADELLRDADSAMYDVKIAGKSGYRTRAATPA